MVNLAGFKRIRVECVTSSSVWAAICEGENVRRGSYFQIGTHDCHYSHRLIVSGGKFPD